MLDMVEKVQIGKFELYVNFIGFGINVVGGYNLYFNLNEEVGKDFVYKVLDNGINFFDIVFIYGLKCFEELIGEVLKECGNCEEVVIVIKGVYKIVGDEVLLDNFFVFLKQLVEDSLKCF